MQYVLEQGLALIQEFVLHRVAECGMPRHLDDHRANGAGLLAGLLADGSPSRSRSSRNLPVPGGTATWRHPR